MILLNQQDRDSIQKHGAQPFAHIQKRIGGQV